MLKTSDTLFRFLKDYGNLSYGFEVKDGKETLVTDTCKIFNAFVRGIFFTIMVIVVIAVALSPIAMTIAELIAQIQFGYYGIGFGQTIFAIIFGVLAIMTILNFSSEASKKSASIKTIKETIASKAGKYCQVVRIQRNEN